MANPKYFDADHPGPFNFTDPGGANPHYRLDPLTDTVVRDGEDDIQQMIDAAEGSVNINNIIARYRQSGDPALLQQRQYMFGDLSVQEGSYQQMILLGNQIRATYDALDPAEREKVGSLRDFMAMMSKEPPAEPAPASDGSIEIGGVKYVPQASSGFQEASAASPSSGS